MQRPDIQEIADFLIDYAAKMLSVGTYTEDTALRDSYCEGLWL